MSMFKNYLLKPLMILAIAAPVLSSTNVSNANAGSSKRTAIIAGAIIGGAIGYHAYKRNKRQKYRRSYARGHGYYAPSRSYRVKRHRVHRKHQRGHFVRHRYGNSSYRSDGSHIR